MVKQWYKHSPVLLVIDGNYTVTWSINIVVNKSLNHNRPDIVNPDIENSVTNIIDIVVLSPLGLHMTP
eukprot:712233-Ditylum_brightwellii.AAC.1